MKRVTLLPAVLCLSVSTTSLAFAEGVQARSPSVVRLVEIENRQWRLERNDEPFFVKGVGGSDHLDVAASFGANSIRTWGVNDETAELLDRAHANGITVTLGYWLGHKRHGFNVHDAEAVANQKAKLLEAVRRFKDHPALLAWGVGNEVELEQENDPKVWQVINDAAKAIKEIDPNHPTVIIIAELGADLVKLRMIRDHCPDIDIVGLNAYDGAASIAGRYAEFGLNKPCLLTEYGPALQARDEFGKVAEPTSSEKAQTYARIYREGILSQPGLCLGGYSFVWGSKVEMTDTYFGQLLSSGERLAQAEIFHELFEAPAPTNGCPQVNSLVTSPTSRVALKGEPLELEFRVTDPDSDPLTYRWELKTELRGTMGGDHLDSKPNLAQHLHHPDSKSSKVAITGAAPGNYRVYAYAFDGQGNAATASASIVIKKPVSSGPAPKASLPLTLYRERNPESAYAASGVMGDRPGEIRMQFDSREDPHTGETSLRVAAPANAWSGTNWQHPPGDWGKREGGFDLSGAKRLHFWARGSKGGEKVTFALGGIGQDAAFPDTTIVKREVTLTTEWQEIEIDLTDADLTRIKTPFHWSIYDDEPVLFFLDDIRID